jgi:hypothetical protein
MLTMCHRRGWPGSSPPCSGLPNFTTRAAASGHILRRLFLFCAIWVPNLRSGAAEKAADRPPQDEPSVAAARNSALEPSARSKDDKHHAYALPVRSYDLLIKIVLLLLIVAGLAGAAYLQRNTLASLLASYLTNSGMNIWDLGIPVFAYGVTVLVLFYWLFRKWFGIRH